LSKTIITTLSS